MTLNITKCSLHNQDKQDRIYYLRYSTWRIIIKHHWPNCPPIDHIRWHHHQKTDSPDHRDGHDSFGDSSAQSVGQRMSDGKVTIDGDQRQVENGG